MDWLSSERSERSERSQVHPPRHGRARGQGCGCDPEGTCTAQPPGHGRARGQGCGCARVRARAPRAVRPGARVVG